MVNSDTDIKKIKQIRSYTENRSFDDDVIGKFNISRLGKEKDGYNRVIKINSSFDERAG